MRSNSISIIMIEGYSIYGFISEKEVASLIDRFIHGTFPLKNLDKLYLLTWISWMILIMYSYFEHLSILFFFLTTIEFELCLLNTITNVIIRKELNYFWYLAPIQNYPSIDCYTPGELYLSKIFFYFLFVSGKKISESITP